MNLSFKKITNVLKFWKAKSDFKANISGGQRILTHWKILMFCFLLASLAVLSASVWIYRDIGLGEFSVSEISTSTKPFLVTKPILDSMVSDFELRQATFEQIRVGKTVLADPSR